MARPTWTEIAPVVGGHDEWGTLALVGRASRFTASGAAPIDYASRWEAGPPGAGRGSVALLKPDDLTVVALGLTFPFGQAPDDVRIWQRRAHDELEWVDAPVSGGPSLGGPQLYLRPGPSESSVEPWQPGRYRIDVLRRGQVDRLEVAITDTFGDVPDPVDRPVTESRLVPPAASDPSTVRFGLFATVDGLGVSLHVADSRPLDEADAWVATLGPRAGSAARTVTSVFLPRATGLGVMLTTARVGPARASFAGSRQARSCPSRPPSVVSRVPRARRPTSCSPLPTARRSPPGAYAISVGWYEGGSEHAGTWHVELRPGPVRDRPLTASAILGRMPRPLSRKVPLAELHCHLGGAVTPAIMWGIAHSQGIKLPTKDYWEFRDMITVSPRRNRSFDGYLQLFHWTELIQSSPLAVERSVYEVVGGAYRKNNVTTMELRFNPMKRNRGGEQDLDHIIAAAVRGMDRATLEYPIKPGLIFCLDRAFPFELNEIIVEKAIGWRDRGVVGVDIAGPESSTFRVADYRRLFRRARQFGLGLTVHTGESGPVEEVARVVELLEPDRIGHGVKAAYDPRAMTMIRERGIVLEICPTSNLNTRVVSGWDEFRWIFDTLRRNEVRFTINTDGPEMLKTYIRDELAQLGRLGILSVADQEAVAATSLAASFVPNVTDVPMPRLEPASRVAVEREEA